MIILIGGVPASGKTTIMKKLIERLDEPTFIEPMPLFKCQEHGDILVLGQYYKGEPHGGTDRLSYASIPFFPEFCNGVSIGYKHTLIEGDRFFKADHIEWLLDNHEAVVYVLNVDIEAENNRHEARGDTQSEVWLKGRRSQINNILTNMNLMGALEPRNNNTIEQQIQITEEIYGKIIQ